MSMTYVPPGKERTEVLKRVGRWVEETCDQFGASPETGFLVAGVFVQVLSREWEKRDAEKQVAA